MSEEFKRFQQLAGLPITENKVEETTETLNENFVGIPAINNVFEREKTDYELAFEHFAKGDLVKEEMESSLDGKKLFISIDVQSDGWSTNIQHKCDIVKINTSDGKYFILASTPKGEKIKINMEDQETLDGFLNGRELKDEENPYNFIYLK